MSAIPGHNPSRPQPKGPVDLEAMARRVLARDRGDLPGDPPRLHPGIFEADRTACVVTQGRLEALLRDLSAFHHAAGAQGQEGGPSASPVAVLDRLADEVAAMPPTVPSIIKLAEAERATHPLEATPDITAVLDSCGSAQGSIEALVTMLITAMKVRKPAMPKDPTEMDGYGDTDEAEANA